MQQSFYQRVSLLSMAQWRHILKKPLKDCKAPINEAGGARGQRQTFSKVCPKISPHTAVTKPFGQVYSVDAAQLSETVVRLTSLLR